MMNVVCDVTTKQNQYIRIRMRMYLLCWNIICDYNY